MATANRISSKNKTLSTDDIKSLYEMMQGKIPLHYIQQVAKAQNYNVDGVVSQLLNYAEEQSKQKIPNSRSEVRHKQAASRGHSNKRDVNLNNKSVKNKRTGINNPKNKVANYEVRNPTMRNTNTNIEKPNVGVNRTSSSVQPVKYHRVPPRHSDHLNLSDNIEKRQSVNAKCTPTSPVKNTSSSANPEVSFTTASSTGAVPKRTQESNKCAGEIELDNVINLIETGAKVVVILRGVPGSGKSYLANKVFQHTVGNRPGCKPEDHIFSTDTYFEWIGGGTYKYDPNLITSAHDWNQSRFYGAVKHGVSPLIVDNTNVKYWEMKYYFVEAIKKVYIMKILMPFNSWSKSPSQLAKRTVHNVPIEKIKEMMGAFDPIVDASRLMTIYNLSYPPGVKVPQLRTHPAFELSFVQKQPVPPLLGAYLPFGGNANSPIPVLNHPQLPALNQSLHTQHFANPGPYTQPINVLSGFPFWQINIPNIPKQPFKMNEKNLLNKAKKQENKIFNGTTDSLVSKDTTLLQSNKEPSKASEKSLPILDPDIECPNYKGLEAVEDNLGNSEKNQLDHKVVTYTRKELLDILPEVDRTKLKKHIFNEFYKAPKSQPKSKDSDNVKPKTPEPNVAFLIDWAEDCEETNQNKDEKISVSDTLSSLKPLLPRNMQADLCTSILDEPIEEDLPTVSFKSPFNTNGESSEEEEYSSLTSNPQICADETKSEVTAQPIKSHSGNFLGSFKNFFSILNNIQKSEKTEVVAPTPIASIALGDLLVSTCNSCTNTSQDDFSFVNILAENPLAQIPTDCQKVIIGRNRNINENYVPNKVKSPPLRLTLDQSSMTEPEEELNGGGLDELVSIFPHIPKKDLRHMLEQCQGQISWAVDILLESPGTRLMDRSDEHLQDDEENLDDSKDDVCNDYVKEAVEVDISQSTQIEDDVVPEPDFLSEEVKQLLKNMVENKFEIDDSHYSDRVRKIRNFRNGKVLSSTEEDDNSTTSTDSGSEENQGEESSLGSADSGDDEHCMELNVGFEFIENLNTLLGSSSALPLPDGLKPNIKVPKSLAEQLNLLWLESYYQQVSRHEEELEKMFKEDEEFAKQLQERENELNACGNAPNVSSMQDLMRMEIDLEIAKQVQSDELAADKYEDLATRLTQQKLFDMFPDIEHDTICQILEVFGNRYDQTVQLLQSDKDSVSESAFNEGDHASVLLQEKELLKEARQACTQFNEVLNERQSNLNESTDYYQNVAQTELRLRHECLEKARSMYTRGLTSGAAYYSELAQLHKNKFDYANRCASLNFANEQTNGTNGKDKTMLDLHSLAVRDAMEILNIFIDNHIRKLKSDGKKSVHLHIITGRGIRSAGGLAKIKPAAVKMLKKRRLSPTFINPGLLRFKVHNYDAIHET